MNKIEQILKQNIKALGPVSIKEYMSLVLYHPTLGYYSKPKIIGNSGDFITAPEISQVFGELLAYWIILYSKNKLKNEFNYLELGPGRGTLSQDIFRTILKLDKNLSASIKNIYFFEKSKSFIKELKKKFSNAVFIQDFSEIKKTNTIVVANEFFDALPINQYVKVKNTWHEKLISLDANDNFIFVLSNKLCRPGIPFPEKVDEGFVFEYSEFSNYIISSVCKLIYNCGGAFLIFDYSKEKNKENSILAINKHKHVNPFYLPGQTDLSSKPDFSNIERIALREKCKVIGPLTQSFFLKNLGIEERTNMLINKNPKYRKKLLSQKNRLIGSQYMGEIFKVLLITDSEYKDKIFEYNE